MSGSSESNESPIFDPRAVGKAQTARRNADLRAIQKALPELRSEQYHDIRSLHERRVEMAVYYENQQRLFEYSDGEALSTIRFLLTDGDNKGSGMWTRYLDYCGLPERTARERIQKYEGHYTKRIAAASAANRLLEPEPESDAEPEPEAVVVEAMSPEPSEPSEPERRYAVDAWQALSAHDKAAILRTAPARSTSGFNKQDTDSIEWARWSWNPVTGCLHNCPYCYARDIANRRYAQGFAPTFLPERLAAPTRQRVPEQAAQDLGWRNVFVCSMADLFGKWVPQDWIEAVLAAVRAAPQWNFLFLTKFPVRLAEFPFPDNAWVGTTVDCQARVKSAERAFRTVRARVKWLSIEPLLEPITFTSLEMFQWVVLGGASRSTDTPAWTPPRRWIDAVECQARAAGCMLYEKTNLGMDCERRLREYPGWQQPEPDLPAALRYLPTIGHTDE